MPDFGYLLTGRGATQISNTQSLTRIQLSLVAQEAFIMALSAVVMRPWV